MILNYVDRMKRAFLKRVQAAGLLRDRSPGYRRRLRNEKRKRKFAGNRIVRIRSGLWIKRNFTDNHVRARLYKRVFKGICGAYSWKQLDTLFPRPKVAKATRRPEVPAPEHSPSHLYVPKKKGFLARLADKFMPGKSLA